MLTIAVLSGTFVALLAGEANPYRWGRRRGDGVQVGATPYREATTTALIPNAAPRRLRIVAAANTFWGVLTGLVFAPLGSVLMLFAAKTLGLLIVLMLAVVLSGFGLAFALGVASAKTLRREDLPKARRTSTWSMIHHAAVLVVMGLGSIVMDDAFLVVVSALPCMIGMTLAHLLSRGVEQIERGGYDDRDVDKV